MTLLRTRQAEIEGKERELVIAKMELANAENELANTIRETVGETEADLVLVQAVLAGSEPLTAKPVVDLDEIQPGMDAERKADAYEAIQIASGIDPDSLGPGNHINSTSKAKRDKAIHDVAAAMAEPSSNDRETKDRDQSARSAR